MKLTYTVSENGAVVCSKLNENKYTNISQKFDFMVAVLNLKKIAIKHKILKSKKQSTRFKGYIYFEEKSVGPEFSRKRDVVREKMRI